ncbi:MAG TPA: hypothetical protein VF761_16650 [Gemmatimonadaceae bacterium]
MENTTKAAAPRKQVLGYTLNIADLLALCRECPAGNLPGMIAHSTNQEFLDGICRDCATAPSTSRMGQAVAAARQRGELPLPGVQPRTARSPSRPTSSTPATRSSTIGTNRSAR